MRALLYVSLLTLSTFAKAQTSAKDVLDATQSSIVTVRHVDNSVRGIGIVIDNEGSILTVASVVGMLNPEDIQLERKNGTLHGVSLIDRAEYNRSTGLVILKAPTLAGVRPLLMNSNQLEVGATVYTIGFLKLKDFAISQGIVSRYGIRQLFLDITSGKGSQGAPILDGYGSLIGLNNNAKSDDNNSVVAIPSSEIVEYMRSKAMRPAEGRMLEEKIGGGATEEALYNLNAEIYELNQEINELKQEVLNERERSLRYRDSVNAAVESERLDVQRGKDALAEERRRHQATVSNMRSFFDSVANAKAELERLRDSRDAVDNELRLMRGELDKRRRERESMRDDIARLEDRQIELSNMTFIPRMRFDARAYSIYQSLRMNGANSGAMMWRGESSLGLRFGVKSRTDIGDVFGAYGAVNLIREFGAAALPTSKTFDTGLFLEFNNDVKFNLGMGVSNDAPMLQLRSYWLVSTALRFSGNEKGAWGIQANLLKPNESTTYNWGAGIWFAFGSNFLNL